MQNFGRHYDEVVEGLSEVLAPTRLGRGLDPDATVGPLHTRRQRDFVADLLSEARSREAEVRELGDAAGGTDVERGHFLHPALVLDPPADAGIVTEEQFGPALPIIPSGFGREMGVEGLLAFTDTHSVSFPG